MITRSEQTFRIFCPHNRESDPSWRFFLARILECRSVRSRHRQVVHRWRRWCQRHRPDLPQAMRRLRRLSNDRMPRELPLEILVCILCRQFLANLSPVYKSRQQLVVCLQKVDAASNNRHLRPADFRLEKRPSPCLLERRL